MELLELYRATLLITLNWPYASLKIQKSFIVSKNVLSTSLFDETSIQSLCGFSNLTWHWYCPLDQEVSSVNLALHFLLWDWNFLPTDSITLPFSCNSFMLLHFVSSLTLYPFAVCPGLPFLQCKTNAVRQMLCPTGYSPSTRFWICELFWDGSLVIGLHPFVLILCS